MRACVFPTGLVASVPLNWESRPVQFSVPSPDTRIGYGDAIFSLRGRVMTATAMSKPPATPSDHRLSSRFEGLRRYGKNQRAQTGEIDQAV